MVREVDAQFYGGSRTFIATACYKLKDLFFAFFCRRSIRWPRLGHYKYASCSWTAEQSPPQSASPQRVSHQTGSQQIRFQWPHLSHVPELILKGGAVTTVIWMTPGNYRTILQNGSKCQTWSLNLLNILQLILNGRAVTTPIFIAPANDLSIGQDRCKGTSCALNLLHVLELMLNRGAITATVSITPDNDRSICQDCSKGTIGGLNFCAFCLELFLNQGAVTTVIWMAPCNDRSIRQNCGKRTSCSMIWWTFLSSWSTGEQSPPLFGWPQVTTDPSASKCSIGGPNFCTFWSRSWTEEESPPHAPRQRPNHWPTRLHTCGLNLLHAPELILNTRAVTTARSKAAPVSYGYLLHYSS